MGTSLSTFGALPGQSGIPYDAMGNRLGFAATLSALNGPDFNYSHTLSYTYDARDELTEEKSAATSGNTAPATASDVYDQTFAFDLAYNRTSFEDVPPSSPFSYMFGPDNQNSNTAAFTYDGSGNPTQYNGSGTSAYAYDPEQRLTGLGGFSAHYDGDGLRDYTIASGTTTYYLYDGSSPLLEETYSGSTTTLQVANGYADGWRERYAVTSFGFNAYGFDPQGSLNVEDSSFNTTLPCQNVYVYDGYGNRLVGERVSTGSTTAFNIDPVQFGGQYGYYTDTSTGEVQLTHRYYDAPTGHFLNRDPIGYAGGQNLYAFCGNNPINESDPEGTRLVPPTTALGLKEYNEAIAYLEMDPLTKKIIDFLDARPEKYMIIPNHDMVDSAPFGQREVNWDPNALLRLQNSDPNTGKLVLTDKTTSPALNLGHELVHEYLEATAPFDAARMMTEKDPAYTNENEKYVVTQWEQGAAKRLGEDVRFNHFGILVETDGPLSRKLPPDPPRVVIQMDGKTITAQ